MAKIKPHFPSIFRSFPEKLAAILFFLLFGAMIISGLRVYNHFQQRQQVLGERQAITEKTAYWEEVARKYKGYRDAYFQLAVLHYQLGNIEKANIYLQEALRLDPNFEEGRELEKLF